MTLRKTKRHSKRRRAHSKKNRRTYKMRGGGIAKPEVNDLIMYFRGPTDTEGYEGIIESINKGKDDDEVMVSFLDALPKKFTLKEFKKYVDNYYKKQERKLVFAKCAEKNKKGHFPQIAFIEKEDGRGWKALIKPSSRSRSRSRSSSSSRSSSRSPSSRDTSTDA